MPDARGKDETKSSEGEGSLPESAAAVAGGFGGEEQEVGGIMHAYCTKETEGMGRAV